MRSITIVCTFAATFLQTTFTYCRKFRGVQNFVTVKLVTKITKISTPQKLPAIRYKDFISCLIRPIDLLHSEYFSPG